jgi:FkbM family methyltransferase
MKINLLKAVHDIGFLLSNPGLIRWANHGLQIRPNIALRAVWLREKKFDTVLDIGANVGQAAINFCSIFSDAIVHSFEPIPDCFEQLKKVSAVYSNLVLHNIGLGDTETEMPFFQNAYTPSSSLLPMRNDHVESYPKTADSKKITIQVKCLDQIADSLALGSQILVKIDVQGFEGKVIAGGRKTISKATVVIIETSLESMYEGDASFDEIYSIMLGLGFTYAGSFEQLIDAKTNRMLQQDAVFVKK